MSGNLPGITGHHQCLGLGVTARIAFSFHLPYIHCSLVNYVIFYESMLRCVRSFQPHRDLAITWCALQVSSKTDCSSPLHPDAGLAERLWCDVHMRREVEVNHVKLAQPFLVGGSYSYFGPPSHSRHVLPSFKSLLQSSLFNDWKCKAVLAVRMSPGAQLGKSGIRPGNILALFLEKGNSIDGSSFTVSKCSLFESYLMKRSEAAKRHPHVRTFRVRLGHSKRQLRLRMRAAEQGCAQSDSARPLLKKNRICLCRAALSISKWSPNPEPLKC